VFIVQVVNDAHVLVVRPVVSSFALYQLYSRLSGIRCVGYSTWPDTANGGLGFGVVLRIVGVLGVGLWVVS